MPMSQAEREAQKDVERKLLMERIKKSFVLPVGVAYADQVAAACDWLLAQGYDVTYAKVRTVLGDTGSYKDMVAPINAWKTLRKAPPAPPPVSDAPAPEFVLDEVNAIASRLWAAATAKADEKLKTERDEMAATKATWEKDLAEARELGDDIEGQRKAQQEAADLVAVELEQVHAQLVAATTALEAERAARATAESNGKATSAALGEAHAALDQARESLKDAQRARDSATAAQRDAETAHRGEASKVGRLEGQLAAATEAAQTAKAELNAARAEAKQSAQDASERKGQLQQMQTSADAATAEIERLRSDLDAARADMQAAAAEASELRGQLQAQRANGDGKTGKK